MNCFYDSYAQTSWQPNLNSSSKQNTIKINPVNPFFGQYQLAYERMLNDKISIQLEGGFISRTQKSVVYDVKSEKSGFIAMPAFRYYFYRQSDDEPMFYFSANYRFRQLRERFTDNEYYTYSHHYSRYYNGLGVTIGGQYYIFDLVSIEVFGGLQYGMVTESYRFDTNNITQSDYENQFPLATFTGSYLSNFHNFPLRAGIVLGIVF
jgi:hypothetical protein